MSKVLTFSRVFPKYHPKAGQPTFFVEKILHPFWDNVKWDDEIREYIKLLPEQIANPHHFNPKVHTIRAGKRWEVGDKFSPRIWSGKPYCSPQITIAPDFEIKKIWDFDFDAAIFLDESRIYINNVEINSGGLINLARNDGLDAMDLLEWFGDGHVMNSNRKNFSGQIICWNEKVNY